MKLYEERVLENIKEKIYSMDSKQKYKKSKKDFTRERKMPFEKVALYPLAQKGITSKMEIIKFDEIIDTADISSPAVLKQREKLSSNIYVDMIDENNICFYNEYSKQVKLFKGYIVTASDGSDFEIPNTILTRSKCGSSIRENSVARLQVCNTFDLLNGFILKANIGYGKCDERTKANENLWSIKKMNLKYPILEVRDRGFMSLKDIYYLNKQDDKYVIRFDKRNYRKAITEMNSNDETIKIEYEYNRNRHYKIIDPEYYELMEKTKADTEFRVVIVELENGEKEYLATNLEANKFSYEDIKNIYRLRWGIETNFHVLKENMKIEAISSSKDELIKQDIFSQMLACNTLQAFINTSNKKINQEKYKHEMKTNMNMAIGFFKKYFIYILIETDETKKRLLIEQMETGIKRYLVPIRKNRNFPRNKNRVKNKHSINKRKSF